MINNKKKSLNLSKMWLVVLISMTKDLSLSFALCFFTTLLGKLLSLDEKGQRLFTSHGGICVVVKAALQNTNLCRAVCRAAGSL